MSWNYFPDAIPLLLSENPLLARLFFASIEVTVLALAVAMLIRLARIRSPRVIALLWLVVLVKPVVSLALGSPLAIPCFEPATTENLAAVEAVESTPVVVPEQEPLGWADPMPGMSLPVEPSPSAPAAPSQPVETTGCLPSENLAETWLPMGLLAAWFGVVVFSLGRYAYSHVKLRRILAASSVPSGSVMMIYRSIASQLGFRRVPRLVLTDALDSPAMAGLLRPVVLVPSWLAEREDGPELVWSLRHELMHWRWLDPAAIAVRDLAAILFAFHPIVWWAARRQTEALELACDHAVLQGGADATDYAEQLYQILRNIRHRRRAAVAGGLFATRTQIGRRIAALLDGSQPSARRLTVFSVAGVLLLAFGALAIGGAVGGNSDGEGEGDTEERPARSATGRTRTLRFPKTHRIGLLFTRPPRPLDRMWRQDWTQVKDARGRVRVPADEDTQIVFSEGLSSFPKESPGTIHAACFWYAPPDSAMEYLARCRKLKWVAFREGLPSPASWKYFSQMGSLEALAIGSSKITDGQLMRLVDPLAELKSFRWLEIHGTELTDDGLAPLRRLPRLETVFLQSNKLDGRGLAHLAALPRLRYLHVSAENLADGALEHLVGCTSLKHLGFYGPKLTPAGLAPLGKLTSPEEVSFQDMPITDEGLAHLSGLTSLRKINLRSTMITDAGLAHLAGLTSLEDLDLSRNTNRKLTDVGLAHLRNLTKMKKLNLQAMRHTGAGLEPLAGMKQLQDLSLLAGCTDEDMAIIGTLSALKHLSVSSRKAFMVGQPLRSAPPYRLLPTACCLLLTDQALSRFCSDDGTGKRRWRPWTMSSVIR